MMTSVKNVMSDSKSFIASLNVFDLLNICAAFQVNK